MQKRLFSIQWAFLIYFVVSCTYNDISIKVDCSASDLTIALGSKTDATSCKAINGTIIVTASGGVGAYDFSINNGIYQTNSTFSNLAPGNYTLEVKDANGCKRSIQIDIGAANSNLEATITTLPDSQCLGDNGTIAITATGGNPPYQYQLDAGGFGSNNTFDNLKSGQHVVVVKDNQDCQKVLGIVVAHGNTGTSYANTIKPILDANCNLSGCHDASSGARNWTTYANVSANAANIKTRTGNKTMPIGDKKLTQEQIDKIACWVDDGAPNN